MKKKDPQNNNPEPIQKALEKVRRGPLGRMLDAVTVRYGKSMGKQDWAVTSNTGWICLNPQQEGSIKQWEYVISHCLLHLGFGHARADRETDLRWNLACNLVIARFLLDNKIGTPPMDVDLPALIQARDEENIYRELQLTEELSPYFALGTMGNGKIDLIDCNMRSRCDYPALLAQSLENSIRRAIRQAAGQEGEADDSYPGSGYGSVAACERARGWFLSSYPLLGAVAAEFKLIWDYGTVHRMGIKTAAVSVQLKEIYINPYARLDEQEWRFVLAHEYLHGALRHDLRCEGRNPILWNVACDYVINGWLAEMNIGAMPGGALYDDAFRSLSAEGVYDLLEQNIRYYLKQQSGDILYGDPAFWDTLVGAELDKALRSALHNGLTYHECHNRGYLPGDFVEEVHAVCRPPIPWDVQLARWFEEQFAPEEICRTYARMSRRQASVPDIPRPGWKVREDAKPAQTFAVLLDTSASMERHLLAAALGSIASYSEVRGAYHVRVVFCDAAAYDMGIMSPAEIAGTVKVQGRGGTKLQPGIDLLDKDVNFPKDAPLLIITDGACDRLNIYGRKHAYLIPSGCNLPFQPRGEVFILK